MNPGHLTLTPVLPLWLILLISPLGLILVILQYLLIRGKLGRSRALAISFLRMGVFLPLISFFLNPTFVERKVHKAMSTLAILLDTSQSMGISPAEGKRSRFDEARSVLLNGQSPLLKSLAERFEVRLYTLGDSLKPVEGRELASLKPGGERGDLTGALTSLGGENSLVLLFSDGNVKLDNRSSTGPTLLAYPVGDPKDYKDILIKAVKAPALAFRGRQTGIDVIIKTYGYKDLTIPVLLKDGNRLITAKSVRIKESPAEITASLSFTPEEVGHHSFSVSIAPQFGESLTSNNTVNFSLKVVRDKIRILMASGNPSLSYRFMRMAFKNDPSIDLLSFIILRTPSDIINVPLQEQSLIPFPVETLFSKELKNFDLVIFDNFPFSLYISSNHLQSLREFVKEGGGFAVIGGPNLSNAGGYGIGLIGDVLPVRFTGTENYRRNLVAGVKLSRAGTTHPLTQLSLDKEENIHLWQEMPALDGLNLLETKGSGTVLLESSDGTSRPVLVLGNYGKGRVLSLATDYSWKWYMGMVGRGQGNWAYFKLMERMARWLTKDPSLEPLEIILPERAGLIGQEREIRIKVREEDFSSRKGAVSLSVLNPDGARVEAKLRKTGPSGEYLASFLPEKAGAYRVKIETPSGSLEESVMIAGTLEDFDGAPDIERLRMASTSTGGKLLSKTDDLLKEIETYSRKDEKTFVEERHIPLWGTLYILILIVALLSTEWYLRRRWGLI